MLKGLSLFANVGIAESYLNKVGIEIVIANELLQDRANFYSHFYPTSNMVCGDITNKDIFNSIIKKSKEEKIDFLIATPPCQGMSQAGKMSEDDPRNLLIIKVVQAIKEIKPKYVFIENVPAMLKTYIKMNNKTIKIEDFLNKELSDDYIINHQVVNTKDFLVPQSRKRSVILLTKKSENFWNFPNNKEKEITVRDVIGDLPSLESGESSNIRHHNSKEHNERHIHWMMHTPTGKTAFDNLIHYPMKDGRRIKGFRTTYKRMEWDKPAPTITMANGGISSQNNVHPGRKLKNGCYSDSRVLTILELLRLSSLPDDWDIPSWSSDSLVRKVIGEGIPPKLVQLICSNIVKKS
jgi:DNA (cytosine-5)-methyltransferase 1